MFSVWCCAADHSSKEVEPLEPLIGEEYGDTLHIIPAEPSPPAEDPSPDPGPEETNPQDADQRESQEFEVKLKPEPNTRLFIDGATSADRAKALKQQLSKLIAAWNDDHPDKKVKNGDVIMSVNGRKNDEEALYTAIETKGPMTLVVRRQVAR